MIRILMVSKNESDNTLIQKKLEPLKKDFGAMKFYSARPAELNLDARYRDQSDDLQ